jgi:IclR family pca regulon transcriptional regulator
VVTEAESSRTDGSPSQDHVRSLARGLAVIRAFDEHSPRLTLSEVARRTDLTRAAARRFLLTLADLGYVSQDENYFALTPRVLELGYAYLASVGLPSIAQPHLERVAKTLNESCSVSVLDGTDVVYIARVATSRIMKVSINVGTRFPAHATSMGQVLLAGMHDAELTAFLHTASLERHTDFTLTEPVELRRRIDEVRAQGYSIVDQELEEGLRSIAVPIRDRSGRVCAGMNVSVQAGRVSLEELASQILPVLVAGSADVTADLALLGD